MLAVFCAAAPARAAVISFDSLTVNEGDPFSLGILVTDVDDLLTFQFDISFNPAVLTATGTTEGPLLASQGGLTFFIPGFLPGEPLDDPTPPGLVRQTAGTLIGEPGISVPADAIGVLPIAFVTFLATGSGDPNVTISNVLLLNSLGAEIDPILIANGTVTVVPTTVIPEPATLVLTGIGLAAVARRARRRHQLSPC
jgi:general secretion pathway protein D